VPLVKTFSNVFASPSAIKNYSDQHLKEQRKQLSKPRRYSAKLINMDGYVKLV